MEIERILKNLEFNRGKFPQRALKEAIAKRDEIIPELLKVLEFANKNIDYLVEHQNYFAHIYALYLLAQFREKRAYPLIVELVSRPADIPYEILGDIVTEDLPSILASVSCGDTTLIKKIVENRDVDEFVRGSALRTLVVLFVCGEQSWEEVKGYFKTLFREKLERKPGHVWSALVRCCCDIKATELYDDIKQAYEEELVDTFTIDWEDVEDSIYGSKEDALNELADNEHYQLMDDIINVMNWWACFKPSREDKKTDFIKPSYARKDIPKIEKSKPVVKEHPKVGRNEPCPCGSGKKYKKCCLQKDLLKSQMQATSQTTFWPAKTEEQEEDIFDDTFTEVEDLCEAGKFEDAINCILNLKRSNKDAYKEEWGAYDEELIALFMKTGKWDEVNSHIKDFIAYPLEYYDGFVLISKLIQAHEQYQLLYSIWDRTIDEIIRSREIPLIEKNNCKNRYIFATIIQYLTMPERFNFSFITESLNRHNIKPGGNLEMIISAYKGERIIDYTSEDFLGKGTEQLEKLSWLLLEFVAWLKKEGIANYGLGDIFRENISEYLSAKDVQKRQPLFSFNPRVFDEYLSGFFWFATYLPLEALSLFYGLPLYFRFLQSKGLVSEEVMASVYKQAKKMKPDIMAIIGSDLWKFEDLFSDKKICQEIGW